MLQKYFRIFIVSMIPLIELRGAIPVATALGLMSPDNVSSMIITYAVCILGNMVPVPFIYLFARRFLEWGQDKKIIGKMCTFFLVKGKKGGQKLQEKAGHGLFVALFLFVGIPLPGTGAWTGTLAASLLDMDFKETVIAVVCGVLLAGIIMLLISLGVFGAVQAVAAQ
ncbi:MAG: small multi-drug export protein [Treponema sp.]|nr:small multi-drug export protein [Treponema sp.]